MAHPELSGNDAEKNNSFFSFQVASSNEIGRLTKLVSIDNVKGSNVWAYARIKQYLEFQKLGDDITLLPYPGDGPGSEMTGYIALSQLTTLIIHQTLIPFYMSSYPIRF